MATTHEIALFDWVELLEPVDAAPVGAQGGLIEFHDDGKVGLVEIMKPDLDGLERLVFVTLSKLRRIDDPSPSNSDPHSTHT